MKTITTKLMLIQPVDLKRKLFSILNSALSSGHITILHTLAVAYSDTLTFTCQTSQTL